MATIVLIGWKIKAFAYLVRADQMVLEPSQATEERPVVDADYRTAVAMFLVTGRLPQSGVV